MNQPLPSPLQHFYRTSAQVCPYLPGQAERKVITELVGPAAQTLYNDLSRAGFRRSHQLAYRPACPSCTACQPVRIAAAQFIRSKSIRRTCRINADLSVDIVPPRATLEQYRLFTRYQLARHGDSDMAGMSFSDYRSMIEDSPVDTVLLTCRDAANRLMGVCLTDELDDGVSAVYSFFEPDAPQRSLGTWLVVQLIDRVRERQVPYVYLGYWIAESRKMAYKTRFQPLEALTATGWIAVDAPAVSEKIIDGTKTRKSKV